MLIANDNVERHEQQPDMATLAGCKNKLIGTHVVVESSEGEQYTGILKEFTDEFVITLSFAQKMPTSEDSEFILCEGTTEKVLKLNNVVRLSGSIDEREQSCKTFRTDREIVSEPNGESSDKDPELLPWSADGELPESDDLFPDTDEKGARRTCNSIWEDGWKVDAMFEMNKDKVVGKSTFDESLSQYSNVEVKMCTDEQIKRAEQIVKSIEGNMESKRNALLENHDEERDLDSVAAESKAENRSDQLQQPPQQQRQQRVAKEGPGQRKVSGSSATGGKRWTDRGPEQSTTNWRSPVPQPSQHAQRGNYGAKPHRQASFHPPQNPRPYQQQYHPNAYFGAGKEARNVGGRTPNYEMNSTQNLSVGRNRTDVASTESRIATLGPNAKPIATPVTANNGVPSHHFQPHREEQTPQQIPPDPEIMEKEIKHKQETVANGCEQREGKSSAIEEKMKEPTKEGTESAEQQPKFKLNPAAAPFVPKPKDLNIVSATSTTNTSPLMSNQVPSFVHVPAVPTQAISTQNLVFYHQQSQAVVPAQMPSNPMSYHQQPQTVMSAHIPPNPMSYHQHPQTAVLPGPVPSNQIFYQQQPQTVVPTHLPSNPLYATYPFANPGQSFVLVSPNAPNQAVILQQGVAQHFIPVSAATLSQNINQHYRTVTPNGVNAQAPMTHPPTNIYAPPPLHPGTQGMIIQSPPVQPLLNITMPPNGVVSAAPPPTSFHQTVRYQQQF